MKFVLVGTLENLCVFLHFAPSTVTLLLRGGVAFRGQACAQGERKPCRPQETTTISTACRCEAVALRYLPYNTKHGPLELQTVAP